MKMVVVQRSQWVRGNSACSGLLVGKTMRDEAKKIKKSLSL